VRGKHRDREMHVHDEGLESVMPLSATLSSIRAVSRESKDQRIWKYCAFCPRPLLDSGAIALFAHSMLGHTLWFFFWK
jgi:hypothetical protein